MILSTFPEAWTYLRQMNKTWAELSTLNVGTPVYAIKLHIEQKQPYLKFKTWLKQLLSSLLLTFSLAGRGCVAQIIKYYLE